MKRQLIRVFRLYKVNFSNKTNSLNTFFPNRTAIDVRVAQSHPLFPNAVQAENYKDVLGNATIIFRSYKATLWGNGELFFNKTLGDAPIKNRVPAFNINVFHGLCTGLNLSTTERITILMPART